MSFHKLTILHKQQLNPVSYIAYKYSPANLLEALYKTVSENGNKVF